MKLSPPALKAQADDACALLKALATPHRPMLAARRDGQTIYYGLRSGRARALVETLSQLFCAVPDRALPYGAFPCSKPPRPRI